jgi:hypothetical protein
MHRAIVGADESSRAESLLSFKSRRELLKAVNTMGVYGTGCGADIN